MQEEVKTVQEHKEQEPSAKAVPILGKKGQ